MLFALLMAPGSWLRADDSLIQQAQTAWNHRDQPGQTERAIDLWKQAVQQDPKRGDLYIWITRACGRACRNAAHSKDRDQWAEEGRRFGAQAIAANPHDASAFTEYGAALGQWAQNHKGFHGVKVVHQAIENLKQALALNPHQAQAHMVLAEIYRHAPSWISGGSKAQGLEHARLAVQYGDAYAIDHLVLAKALRDQGDKEAARKELERTLALTPPADAVPETRSDQESARKLLVKMGYAPAAAAPSNSVSSSAMSSKPCEAAGEQCSEPPTP